MKLAVIRDHLFCAPASIAEICPTIQPCPGWVYQCVRIDGTAPTDDFPPRMGDCAAVQAWLWFRHELPVDPAVSKALSGVAWYFHPWVIVMIRTSFQHQYSQVWVFAQPVGQNAACCPRADQLARSGLKGDRSSETCTYSVIISRSTASRVLLGIIESISERIP